MNVESIVAALESALPAWLPNQRWFSAPAGGITSVHVVEQELLINGDPALLWALVQVNDDAVYQVPVGIRSEKEIGPTLLGHGNAQITTVELDGTHTLLYDGLIDGVLTKTLYATEIAPGTEEAGSVRPIGLEQSNTSLVYDNQIICKIFRRLHEGANPDLEVTSALTEAGFESVAAVLATWERGEWDLAMAQPFLSDGADGWSLALASVRDFLRGEYVGSSSSQGSPNAIEVDPDDPSKAGGNFGNEAQRLGEMTAKMHLALALKFGTQDFDLNLLADSLAADLDVLDAPSEQKALQALIEQLREVPAGTAGKAGRTHGDFHFGQTLRSTGGWFVFDFEGEPARTFAQRRTLTSPLKDTAGLLRSLHYASASGLSEQIGSEQEGMSARAESWEQYNCSKFRQGYLNTDGIDSLLPSDSDTRDLVLRGFEVEKALYELAYEKAYRPDWINIPLSAIRRLLAE